jgi:hypothetical protein
MPRCELDHLVIAASSLEAGVTYLEQTLGVHVPEGGKHPLMGTHNCLMQIGNGAFLELIAIDPDAPKPDHPRWFNLDDPQLQASIAERPRLHTWVVRTDNIADVVSASPISPGQIEDGRRGDRVWNITIRADGTLAEDGLFPTLIEWPDFAGPATGMADLDCQLESLILTHRDPDGLLESLSTIGADHLVKIDHGSEAHAHGLQAKIKSPNGLITLN